MASNTLSFLSLSLIFIAISFPFLSNAISSCNGPCKTGDDCQGQLTCINGKCNDDPNIGSKICSSKNGGSPPSSGGGGSGSDSCQPSGRLNCKGKSFPKFTCSPPVTSSTRALLTLNDFSEGGDGGGRPECDERFHDNSERVVALSTGWYDGGSRCGKMIRITANNGKSVLAKVVDECDSRNGCDGEHDGQPPCKNNIVDGSAAVWDALGLDQDIGVVGVTWSLA